MEKVQPPRTDEEIGDHTVTEQAVERAIEQAVERATEPGEQAIEPGEQVIDDKTPEQESQTNVTAVDIFFLEQDNRARVAESACMQTVYSRSMIVNFMWMHQRRPVFIQVCPVWRFWMLCSNLSSST